MRARPNLVRQLGKDEWACSATERNVVSKQVFEDDQIVLAAKAKALKDAGETLPDHPIAEDHPNPGANSVPRPDYPPSGAFDAEGQRPMLERSRKER